ncbi:MAG: nitrate reductase [SAR324 cluster bacterium]|uniref:Nitrate reductase n=1 Tax=SAR324 cluster bacterium TaxID=2024889 RepID=A0A2A4T007_9DELT|nr:MAG: nitrate reductase [SAR324 cluster bacterium]
MSGMRMRESRLLKIGENKMTIMDMVCGYCSTGCSLQVPLKEKKAGKLSPVASYPVNLGKACLKGREALAPLSAVNRAVTPLLRNQQGAMEKVGWHQALNTFVKRFKKIQATHGQESVAFLSTGQIPTEEMAFLGVLTKFGMGIRHGDANTRQCMATSVTAYKQSFGFDAPPYTYSDFEQSDVLIFVGANPCIAQPVMWQRVRRNPNQPKIVVIDPRKTKTALAATHHLALQPKSDLTLFYGIANILIESSWIDSDYIAKNTNGFDSFRSLVRDYPLERLTLETGLAEQEVLELASLIHQGKRVSFWWTMGVNQSHQGVRTAQSLINLALMTGNIGRPGTGANSITGQCNAMGSRLFSNTTGLLGGRDFLNEADRKEVAEILEIPQESIPTENSLPYHQILEAIEQGKIKGLWCIATNPLHSWVDQSRLKKTLEKLDFFVVQDMYNDTLTVDFADLLLPAAGWGEKEGTFINSERRIGRVKNISPAPGEAQADFYIFKSIAEYWGCEELLQKWETPETVFQLLKKLSKNRPCDFSGIKAYSTLDQAGGIQWPFPKGAEIQDRERRLFSDGIFFHPDGKARFLAEESRPLPEAPDDEYDFLLLTGRGTIAQWHTQTRTENSALLRKSSPQEIYVEINPHDASQLNIQSKDWIQITSRRGSIKARVFITPHIGQRQLFIPMHYKEVNELTNPSFDPYSAQPSFKDCAVKIQDIK